MNTVSKLEKLPLLSELSEDQARGDILQIYQEIRRLSAVPMVALIWRHLATLPGTLEWAWDFLAPAMRGGALQQMAWQLAEKTRIPRQPAIDVAALRAAGISEEDQRGITDTLDGYNRANPVNFVMVRCLSLHLAGTTGATHQQSAQLIRALEQFSIRIPEMVVIGNLVRAALPAAPRHHKSDASFFSRRETLGP